MHVKVLINLGKFTEPFIDVLTDEPHPQFGKKFVGTPQISFQIGGVAVGKVRLIRRC